MITGASTLDPRTLHLQGLACAQRGQFAEAVDLLRRSVELSPTSAGFRVNLAGVLGTLGRHAEAEAELREALRLHPDWPPALGNLGVALEHQDRYEEAAEVLGRAVRLEPSSVSAHTHLSNALRKGGRTHEALAAADQAVTLGPDAPEAHNARGAALVELNRSIEALACFHRAMALQPGHADASVNAAMALLAQGDLEAGFRAFESRLNHPTWRRELPGRRWTIDGAQDIAGKTVLVYAEGGLGNTIQFVRFVKLLAERGARVVLECHKPLMQLMRAVAGVAEVALYGGRHPHYNLYAGIMSLPALLATGDDVRGADVPYARAEPARGARWKERLDELCPRVAASPCPRVLKIGVCWRGDQRVAHLRGRSFAPSELRPLASIPGVTLINLQQGEPVPAELPLVTLSGLEPRSMRLDDVAAVISNLDLVITCDTAIAHLAGALGVPVWVALKYAACWRWMLDREESPWYSTMRLFRQKEAGNWGEVFERMTEALPMPAQTALGTADVC